jgi:hypothetical protein
MLHILLFAAIGAYASRRVNTHTESGIASATIDYQRVLQDIAFALVLVSSAFQRSSSFVDATRAYLDAEIIPWLDRRGIHLSLPSIDLPRLPGQVHETQA